MTVPVYPDSKLVTKVLDAVAGEVNRDRLVAPCWLESATTNPEPSSIVSFRNGLLDVDAYLRGDPQALRQHTPDWFSVIMLPYDFDVTAVCPLWDAYLDHATSGDLSLREALGEWMGLQMVADTKYQKILLLLGQPGTGKGTFLRTMAHVVGSTNCYSSSFASITQSFGLEGAVGKLSLVFPDVDAGHRTDMTRVLEIIKSISGEDIMSINRKNRPEINARLTARITISMNRIIDFPDVANALGRRLIVLPFQNLAGAKTDTDLERKLIQELPGIALWALAGLGRLRQRGQFIQPACGQADLDSIRQAGSPISSFGDQCCVYPDLGRAVSKAMMFEVYKSWCLQQGRQFSSLDRFARDLYAAFPLVKTAMVGPGGAQVPHFTNIGLTTQTLTKLPNRLPTVVGPASNQTGASAPSTPTSGGGAAMGGAGPILPPSP